MPLDVGLLMRIHSVFPAWLEPPMVAITTLGCNTVVAVALAIAVGFWGVLVLLVALGVLLVFLIGFSRLYLGLHYPSDVLGGYLLGTSWAAAEGTVFALWRSRRGRGGHARTRDEAR